MSTHTPGPWLVSKMSKSTVLKDIYIRGGGERIARVVVPSTAQTIDEYHANARLIAAAPDLLEALQKIKHHFDTDEYAYEVASEAIAKFEGVK